MKQVYFSFKKCELAGFEPAISPCKARRSLLCDHQPTLSYLYFLAAKKMQNSALYLHKR